MSKTKDFEKRYQTGDLPWDTGEHDKNLEQVIHESSRRHFPVKNILKIYSK